MIVIAVLSRRLREGKTHEDFREAQLQRIGPQEQRRHDRIDAVIEGEMTHRGYAQVAEDDFTDAVPSS